MVVKCEITCPHCNSEAVYKYGKAWTGRQRYLCLACRKQFTFSEKRLKETKKPHCPACGKLMHVYKREALKVRFRCSLYPACKTFLVINYRKGGMI